MEENTPGPADAGPAAAESALPPDLAEIVERWWNDHFPGSAVARATAAWNHAFAAKEALKRIVTHFEPHGGQ